ncbi:MAG: DUF2064 domain-containing protein [Ignavibacteriae bacterium]|nr:DUF2064 domain-containing protein [Ignavibacteriota bacterium]MCB9217430.1 DUF2064 domain-containing protein [Ignavibacteria bacterium]
MRQDQAILFFVRDEQLEEAIKPLPRLGNSLVGYSAINRAICARLTSLRDRVDIVLSTDGSGSSVETDYLLKQKGRTFGERITHAVEATFALGYKQVVVIGNDSPEITPEDIETGFSLLKSGTGVAAAPTYDGGAFLIALDRDHFNHQTFLQLPWQTPRLFEALCSQLSAISLSVMRADYDSWYSGAAQRVLIGLLDIALCPSILTRTTRFTIPSARRKASTRIFLTAPPLFFPSTATASR